MSLTPEESAKLNTAVEACARAADTVEDVLSLMKSGDAGSAAAAVATHDNAADAHESLFALCQSRAATQKMITTHQTIYVRVDGSDDDSRDGLSAAAAVKTLGGAVQRARFFWSPVADANAAAVTIDIGPGTFASAQDTQRLFLGGVPVYFHGAGLDKTFVKGMRLYEGQNLIVENLSVIDGCELILCNGTVRNLKAGYLSISQCNLINLNYNSTEDTVSLGSSAEDGIQQKQLLYVFNSRVCLYGQINFNADKVSRATMTLEGQSYLFPTSSSVFKGLFGSVSGKRYLLATGSLITSGGRGEEWIPGTEPGTKDASCFYL